MKSVHRLTLSALFVALGIILPFFTGQVPQIGSMLCPMHLPILLCGFVCGGKYGLIAGAVTPLLRHFLCAGMPPINAAIPMTFELAAYGFFSGLLYSHSKKNLFSVYFSLCVSMVAGRIVWGVASFFFHIANGTAFTMQAFIAGAVLNALPGIAVQLILIPAIVYALKKMHLMEHSL